MKNKIFNIFNSIFLIFLIALTIYFTLINFYEKPTVAPACLEEGLGSGFSYETCYDAYSKTIFLSAKRGFDNFKINSMTISFFDFSAKEYEVAVPVNGGSENFKISSEKNPKNIQVLLDVSRKEVCQVPKQIFVNYCPERVVGSDINATVNPLGNLTGKFVELGTFGYINTDKFDISLAEKEKIWGAECASVWSCSEWEECSDGLQKRTCRDSKKCFIPTDVPQTTKYCNQRCDELWECEWAKCVNGISIPNCNDMNNCNTTYNKPKEIKCSNSIGCSPNFICGGWTKCAVNYDFFYLNNVDITKITGVKSRTCIDKNLCAMPTIETGSCSLGVDVYTKVFSKCGTEYIGLYNKLDNKLIAKIDRGTPDQPHMDISLDGENEYCDYCYDGVLDGDEEKIDCGGSCKNC